MPQLDFGSEKTLSNLNFSSRKSWRLGDPFEMAEAESRTPIFFNLFLKILLVFSFFLFVSNLIVLQFFQGHANLGISLNNSLRWSPVKAERGLIIGQKGAILAGNSPSFDLYFDPTLCSGDCNLDSLKKFSFYSSETAKKFHEAKEVLTLTDIGQVDALALGEEIDKYPFLQLRSSQKRDYRQAEKFFHVLGYISQVTAADMTEKPQLRVSDKVGRMGLEKYYDDYLRGLDGGEVFESDARGKVLRKVNSVPSTPGNSVVLNIDEGLQSLSYASLLDGLKNSKAVAGTVVASDPKTGRILTLVSLPSLDPNIFSTLLSLEQYSKLENDPGKPFFNRATAAAYPPGSVFKLAVGSGVLAEGIVTPKTLINGPGSISIGAFSYGDWKPEGHGQLTLSQAIQESCDTCFYTVGGGYGNQAGLGQEKIAKYARLFGFGSTLGIDIPEEVAGLVPDSNWKNKVKNEAWYIGDTYHYAIGQGFLETTALQVNSMTAVVANGGTLYKPEVVEKIIDAEGKIVRQFKPEIIRSNIVDPKFLAVIKEGMVAALKPGGTAYPFYDFKISAAGKTGTAETGKKTTHAWFTVFAPVENPKIALTVFLEDGGEGSRDAAPIARKILDAYFHLK